LFTVAGAHAESHSAHATITIFRIGSLSFHTGPACAGGHPTTIDDRRGSLKPRFIAVRTSRPRGQLTRPECAH
jgi:hypothetical protein